MLEHDIVSHSIDSILIAKEFQVEWHKTLVVCWMFILISGGFRFVTNAVLCQIVFPGSECDAKRMKSKIYIYGVLPATLVLSWLGPKAKIAIGRRQSPNWRTHTYISKKWISNRIVSNAAVFFGSLSFAHFVCCSQSMLSSDKRIFL